MSPAAPIGHQQMMIFLVQVGVLLGSALVLGRLAVRLRMPAVIGELCAGILLGPSLLEHAAPGLSSWLFPKDVTQVAMLDAVGQFGVVLLVGIIGIELDLGLLRRHRATAVRVGLGGLLVPLALGVGAGLLLPASMLASGADRTQFCLVIGVALAVSAIPVIGSVLIELGLMRRTIGQISVAAAALDDVVGWLLLSVVSAMATGALAGQLLASVGGVLAVVGVAALIGRPVVRRVMGLAARARDARPAVGLLVVMLVLSAAATHGMGLEPLLGALVCGTLIGSSGRLDRRALRHLRSFVLAVLAPVFFASAGLRMDLTALSRPPLLVGALALLVAAVVGKFIGAYVGARVSRLSRWEGLAVGAALNARGVIQVVVAMIGLRLGVLNTASYTIIVLVAIATSMMAGPTLRYAVRRLPASADELSSDDEPRDDQVESAGDPPHASPDDIGAGGPARDARPEHGG